MFEVVGKLESGINNIDDDKNGEAEGVHEFDFSKYSKTRRALIFQLSLQCVPQIPTRYIAKKRGCLNSHT